MALTLPCWIFLRPQIPTTTRPLPSTMTGAVSDTDDTKAATISAMKSTKRQTTTQILLLPVYSDYPCLPPHQKPGGSTKPLPHLMSNKNFALFQSFTFVNLSENGVFHTLLRLNFDTRFELAADYDRAAVRHFEPEIRDCHDFCAVRQMSSLRVLRDA